MELSRLVECLSDPAAYPEPTSRVEVVQTHISWIFLTDRFAYKVKKPVDYGFLDYTTLAARRVCCEREVVLNSRLCPDTYLGVVELGEREGRVTFDGSGEVREIAVKMVRLPEDRMLRRVLERGEGESGLFVDLARTLAAFHERARLAGERAAIKNLEGARFNCEENFAQTEKYVDVLVPRQEFEFIRTSTRLFFERRAALFARRVAEGRIVDGHGDLHLDSICATEPARIFDCIEFNERFRIQDTAEEVGFLAMDLEYAGYTPFAKVFVDAYGEAARDRELHDLLDFYKCYRAYVRAKVNAFLSEDGTLPPEQRAVVCAAATRYFELAGRYATHFNPQRLIVMCGLTGSGKSTLARNLASRHRLDLVRSDVVRKELLGLAPDERRHVPYNAAEYAPTMTDQTYAAMLERAEASLQVGKSIVLDGCFIRRSQRELAAGLARRRGVPMLVIECRTSESIIRERLEHRVRKNGVVSDGRWEIYCQQLAEFEPPEELSGDERVVVDRSRPVEELLGELTAVLPVAWQDRPDLHGRSSEDTATTAP